MFIQKNYSTKKVKIHKNNLYRFKILTTIDSKAWNDQLQKNTYATFFQTYEYLYTDNNSEYFPIFILIENENGIVVGQLGLHIIKSVVLYSSPLFRKLIKMFPNITKRAIWIYGPIIHSTDIHDYQMILQSILDANDVILKKYSLVFIEGFSVPNDLMVDINYKMTFEKNGYVTKEFITYIADLTKNIEEIWQNVSKKTRGDVNRAKKRGIIVKKAISKNDLEAYLILHQKWAQTKGLQISEPFEEIEKIWNNIQLGREKIFLAYLGNELISGLRVACFNQIAYTHFVVSSYSKHTNLGGTLLTWSAIEWAKNAGLKYYDFSGGPKEDSVNDVEKNSLLFYKRKWGGKPISHYNFTKAHKKTMYFIYLLFFNLVKKYHDFKMNQYKTNVNKSEDNVSEY